MSKYVMQPSIWNKLGRGNENGHNTAANLIKENNMDYPVDKEQAYIKVQKLDEENNPYFKEISIPNSFGTYRMDTGKAFGGVKSKYEVVQNHEVFSFFDSIIADHSNIKYLNSGIINNGAMIYVTADMGHTINVGHGDEIKLYTVLTNSHDGSSSIRVMLTPVRVWCNNMLAFGANKADFMINIKHTKNARNKINEAAKIMAKYTKQLAYARCRYELLADTKISENELSIYLANNLLREEQYIIELNKVKFTDNMSAIAMGTLRDAFDYTINGFGQQEVTTKDTLWGAYNGLTGYIQNVKFKDSNLGEDTKKFNNMLFGSSQTTIVNGFKSAMDMALEKANG